LTRAVLINIRAIQIAPTTRLVYELNR